VRVNAQTFSGRTPLHLAAAFSSAGCVNALLVAGALQGVCDANGLTAYDAAFLNLAVRHRCPLVTLDREMRRVAQQAGVQVRP
jgi:predicted nucleic acid-binding protein